MYALARIDYIGRQISVLKILCLDYTLIAPTISTQMTRTGTLIQ